MIRFLNANIVRSSSTFHCISCEACDVYDNSDTSSEQRLNLLLVRIFRYSALKENMKGAQESITGD